MTVWPVWVCLCVYIASCQSALPEMYDQLPGGFLPSPVKYFKQTGDQVAMESEVVPSNFTQDNSVVDNSVRPQQARLGLPFYSSTSLNNGYSSSPGVYNPVKLDLGGLLLGTVVGLGAVLLIPKIIHIFSYGANPYSNYGRSEDSLMAGLSEVMARVDQVLAENNINSTSCLQRALCTFVTPSAEPSTVSNLVTSATGSPLVSFLMEGSRLQKAVETGRAGHSCGSAFPQCPFNHNSITAGLQAITSSLQTTS